MTEPTKEGFEPNIVAFLCNWCSYAGADLAGTSRIHYPSNVSVIRVMCTGRVNPPLRDERPAAGGRRSPHLRLPPG